MPAWIVATSEAVSAFVMSMPETSPARHGPIWRMVTVMTRLPEAVSQCTKRTPNCQRNSLHSGPASFEALLRKATQDEGCLKTASSTFLILRYTEGSLE